MSRSVHISFLRERQFIQPREKQLKAIAEERKQDLERIFYALKDKANPTAYHAGLAKASAPEDDDESAALADFLAEHLSSDRFVALDLSIPPMSPSPPPSPSPSPVKSDAPTRLAEEEQTVIEETPELELPTPVPREPVVEEPPVADEEPDAPMPDATPLESAPAVPPPEVVVVPEPAEVVPVVTPAPDVVMSEAESAPAPPPPPPSNNTAPLTSPTRPDSNLLGPTSSLPTLAPSPSPPPPPPPAQTPTLPTASTSEVPYTSAATPSPVPSPVSFSITPTRNGTMPRLAAIDPNYASLLPELPAEILRTRLFGTPRRKGKEKAAVAGPDLYKMHVKAHHTGAKTFLGKSKRVHNVLSTHDWTTGLDEVRATRAFERIEQLKQEKAWSFRQPKKQRVGLVPKAHWDHVLDEMRWLQTDFRQEHRWKVTAAYNLARACKRWHRASPEDRVALCVRVRPVLPLSNTSPTPEEPSAEEPPIAAESAPMEVDRSQGQGGDADADAEGEREATIDVDADADADGEADADADGEADDGNAVIVKMEEVPSTDLAATAAPLATAATAAPLSNPLLAAAYPPDAQRTSLHLQSLIAYRAPVFELGPAATCIDPRELAQACDLELDPGLTDTLASLFPELPIYTKDFNFDPQNEKRWEDSSAWGGKLSFVSHLLETKPLLVSTLDPARNRGKRGWHAALGSLLDDTPSSEHRELAPTTSALFIHPPGKRAKEVEKTEPLKAPPAIPFPAVRSVNLHWSPEEDALVLALHKQYGTHWDLIAEIFNASTNRPQPDYRLGWDLYDRWDRLAGAASRKVLADGTEIPVEPPAFQPPADRATGKSPQFVNFEGSRKRLRHLTVYDAMRKVQKKREITAAKQPTGGIPRRINMSMHESHNLPPRRVLTPMEWSDVKVENDANKLRMRQQQEAQLQQQRLQQQALQQAQLAAQHQGGQPGQQPPNGVRYPQPVPQGFPLAQNRPGLPLNIAQQQHAARQAQMSTPNGGQNGGPPGSTSASPPLPMPMPMPSPNGFQQQQYPNPNGNGQQVGVANMTPEQLQLFTQHRAQLLYQAQVAQQAQQSQQSQQGSQGSI